MSIDLAGLKEFRGLEDGVPAVGIHRIRLKRHASRRKGSHLCVLQHRAGLRLLCPSPAPQHHHPRERKNRPAAPPEGLAACPDLAVRKAQKQRHNHCANQQRQQHRLNDKNETARIPARIEREERPQTVRVCPVQQQVTERGNQRGQIKPSQMKTHRCSCFLVGCGASASASPLPPSMPKPDPAHHHAGHHRGAEKRMRYPAMVLQLLHRPGQRPQHVHVRGLGCQHRREGCVGGLAVQPGAADAGSG